ncbi:scavenger receptor class B, member [Aphanomyces cochlioides]|nr:scavenger receptor class B, member [Aphanomyces cochlioides]
MCLFVAVAAIVVGLVLLSYGSLNAGYRSQRIQTALAKFPTDPDDYQAFLTSPTMGYHMQEPQSTSIYVFNVTNAQDVVLQGAIPQVQELGPYVYTQQSTKLDVATTTSPATVSYRVHTTYLFDPKRSNGSESDVVSTVNVTYARTLAKLAKANFSERLLVASFAHSQLSSMQSFLGGPFIAQTKQRALPAYLNVMDQTVRQAALPEALTSFQAQVASKTLPHHLERVLSHVRQSRVPGMLSDLYDSFLVNFIPTTLSSQYLALRQMSVPRVLTNVVNRLQVEAVPSIVQARDAQYGVQAAPALLQLMLPRILERIAVPRVVRDYMEAACFEAVPSMLATIKNELVQRAISASTSSAVAQQNVLLQWMAPSAPWTDIDALVGGNPTGFPRYGFELHSIPNSTSSRAVSVDVAALLFGANANVEFSLLNYTNASDSSRGFGLWKRAVRGDTTAVAALITGVNNEVATTSDYLTASQVQGIVEYILYWSKSSIIHRDRQRYWAAPFTTRTANSDAEPDVDLDFETRGTQSGFSLSYASALNLADATIARLWDPTASPSFLDPRGFITWTDAMANANGAQTVLQNGFGLTAPQLTAILSWLQSHASSATLKRQVLRAWARGGTFPSPFNNVTTAEVVDLEPNMAGVQSGFELTANPNITWPTGVVEALWDSTQPLSFLHAAGIAQWRAVQVTPTGLSSLTAAINGLGVGSITQDHVRQVSLWLQAVPNNAVVQQAMHQWWRHPAAFPYLATTGLSAYLLNRPALSAAAVEALWTPSSAISIVNLTGYALWMQSTAPTTLQTLWNAQVSATCSHLVGDRNSALFATPVAGSCALATLADVAAIQTYVQQLSMDPYVKTALLKEWQCGAANPARDVEPYRGGFQRGWELCLHATTCNVSSVNNTVCSVSDAALRVWDPSSAVSFLNPAIYESLWLPVQIAPQSSANQAALAAAFGQSQWLPWMNVLVAWINAWVANDVLVTDVLGLWVNATCPVGTLLSRAQSSSTLASASCSGGVFSTTNETLYTKSTVGGRPTTYLTPNFGMLSATDTPTVVVIENQSVVSCSNGTRLTSSTVSIYSRPSCLMIDIDSTTSGFQRGFELNRSTTTLTIDVAKQFWDPAAAYSFVNMTAVVVYWSKADEIPSKLATLLQLVQVDAPRFTVADLTTLIQWLKAWRHNELMSSFVLGGWIAPNDATIPTFDLDPATPATDTGFELRGVFNSTTIPTMSQAQYLWNDANTYSFLTANTDNTNVGFGAWALAYSGALAASERLSNEFPPFARVVRTNQVGNATIVANIAAATGLSSDQIQAIAQWLFGWPDHPFLWRDVLNQWRTQMTQFTDTPARRNLALLDATNGSQILVGFELPTPLPAAVSITNAQARALWDIYTPYSILNPNMLIVWCFVLPSVAQNCPHLVDNAGAVTAATLQTLTTTLKSYQTNAYPDKTFTGTQPMDRARNFLTTVSGLSSPAIVVVASWLFTLPSTSVYQFLMLDRWLRGNLPLDPQLVGYELSTVFNLTAAVPRNATAANMMDNLKCPSVSTTLGLRLWQPQDPLSIVNSSSLASFWLAGSAASTGLSTCQATQIHQWLQSWQAHPWLRQYVEYNWYSTCNASKPCINTTSTLFGPRRGFEISLGVNANATIWPRVARIVWDKQSPLSFLHPGGIRLWRTLLSNCASSNANATCLAASPPQPPSAFKYISSSILTQVGGNAIDVQDAVYTIGQVWLLQMLDNTHFAQFLLGQVGGSSLPALATQQWINASVLRVNFSSTAQAGFASQLDVTALDVWNTTTQIVDNVSLPVMAGFPELRSFCDRAVATMPYDVAPRCSLGTSYTIDDSAASSMLKIFTDTTLVSVRGLKMTRGVFALDTFLAQPFNQLDTCLKQATLLTSVFQGNTSLSNCSQLSLNQFVINGPVFQFTTNLQQVSDMQQYLSYTATRFGYERPSFKPLGSYITQQTVRDLMWRNLATDVDTPTATLSLSNIQFGSGTPLRTPLMANVTANQSTTVLSMGIPNKYGCVIAQVANAPMEIEYQDPTCSYTDGSLFPPGSPSTLSFFWSLGRQVLSLVFSTTVTRFGVPLRRYIWPTTWLNTSASIYDDLPVTITPPHLYNLTSPALPYATGLLSDPSADASVVDVEPLSGIVLHSRFNWQVNVLLAPTSTWSLNVSACALPVFWMRQERSVSATTAASFGDLSNPGPFAVEKAAVWEIVWGAVFVLGGFYLLRRLNLARQRMVRLIQPEQDGNSSDTAKKVDALVEATEPDKVR